MEDKCCVNKENQRNVRDLLRGNLERIKRIEVMTADDLKIISGNSNIEECCKEQPSDMDKNILELVITQGEILINILKTLEETRINLIG